MNAPHSSKHKLSYREYQYLPDDGRRHEIIDGDHYMSPAPSTKHQRVSQAINFALYSQIQIASRGQVFYSPIDVELGPHDIVQPDLIVVMNDRLEIITSKRIVGIPNLVVEILSESNHAHDRVLKFEMFQRVKLPEYWIVDPEAETVEQWVLDEHSDYRKLGLFVDRIRTVTIPEVEVDLNVVWGRE